MGKRVYILPVVLLDPARRKRPCVRIRRGTGHDSESKDCIDDLAGG